MTAGCERAGLRETGVEFRRGLNKGGLEQPSVASFAAVPIPPSLPSPRDPSADPPPARPTRRGPGRPRRLAPQPLPSEETRAALGRLLEIRLGRHSGQRYWEFPFGGEGEAGPRQISVHEAQSKLRAAARLLGEPVETAVTRWAELSEEARHAVGLLLGQVGRSERPRWLSDRTFSWRRLEAALWAVASEAHARQAAFGAVAPTAVLTRELRVGLRTLQKAMSRIRRELAVAPGLNVRVNLWLGDPPPGEADDHTVGRLWVSRWGAHDEREAAAAGLLPADTPAQVKAARRSIRGGRRQRRRPAQ